jgi:hypothetical protein
VLDPVAAMPECYRRFLLVERGVAPLTDLEYGFLSAGVEAGRG